jgi:hypothetical protein
MAQSTATAASEWSGYPHPNAPDDFWIDDATGEIVSAHTGVRLPPNAPIGDSEELGHWTLAMHMAAEGEL